MYTLYIIDPANFEGRVVNTMTSKDGKPVYVDYMDKPTTLEQYKEKKQNPRLIALTWEDFDKKYYRPYLDSLCGKFEEETKAQFEEALNCLPPLRWTRGQNREFFFVRECYTGDLYSCHVRVGDKYYTALRPISASKWSLFNRKDHA